MNLMSQNLNPRNRKRQISVHKFLRIAKNPNAVKIKGLYSAALYIPEVDQALEAYRLGEFIYMWRKCAKQEGNKIKTYFVRYRKGSIKAHQEYVLDGGRV